MENVASHNGETPETMYAIKKLLLKRENLGIGEASVPKTFEAYWIDKLKRSQYPQEMVNLMDRTVSIIFDLHNVRYYDQKAVDDKQAIVRFLETSSGVKSWWFKARNVLSKMDVNSIPYLLLSTARLRNFGVSTKIELIEMLYARGAGQQFEAKEIPDMLWAVSLHASYGIKPHAGFVQTLITQGIEASPNLGTISIRKGLSAIEKLSGLRWEINNDLLNAWLARRSELESQKQPDGEGRPAANYARPAESNTSKLRQ